MSDRKSPMDRALDLFVFAPLGFASEARRLLPDMIEKGRQQLNNQVVQARVMGQYAVQEAEKRSARVVENAQKQAESALETLGRRPARSESGPAPRTSAAPAPAPSPVSHPPAPRPTPTPASPPEVAPRPSGNSEAAALLAIPDYDSLSASQVVPRLAGLRSDELEAVRVYEADHRGRKTILNRVAQLQAG